MPPKRKPGTGRKPRGKLLPAQVLPIGQLLTDLTKRGWSLGAKVGMGGCGEIFLAGMQLFVYRGRFGIIVTYSSPTRPVARELTECQGFNEFRLLSNGVYLDSKNFRFGPKFSRGVGGGYYHFLATGLHHWFPNWQPQDLKGSSECVGSASEGARPKCLGTLPYTPVPFYVCINCIVAPSGDPITLELATHVIKIVSANWLLSELITLLIIIKLLLLLY